MEFRTRKLIKPEDLNAGGTLFGGQLLKWIYEEAAFYFANSAISSFENDDYEDIAKEFMSYMDRQDFKRVLYNAFQSSDCPKPHVDSQSPKGFTYMIYLNPDWDVSMAGETIFVDEPTGEIIKSVVPKRGRLVKFTSEIPHSARPPLRDAMRKRYSMVFQTHPIGLETLGDLL